MKRIYLDHNATSPLRPEAAAAIGSVLGERLGNPSSLHEEGRRARAVVERARQQVAALFGARPRDIVFTSGGSEGIAAAIRGRTDRAPVGKCTIVVASVEHSAVLEAAREAARRGCEIVEVACTGDGRVDPRAFAAAVDDRTLLAALQAANNETGVIQPVEEVAAICRRASVPFLVDAVQTAGRLSWEAPRFGDLIVVSGHKLGGPAGVGALFVREGLALAPLIPGGAQERRRRGGTEAVAAIAGFGAAAEAAQGGGVCDSARLQELRDHFEAGLRAAFPDVAVHGSAVARLPNTTNFAIPGVDGETLAIALDLRGFAVATGSACASGAVEPSHVLRAMGCGEERTRGAVRVSTGWTTVREDVTALLHALPAVCDKVRGRRTAR